MAAWLQASAFLLLSALLAPTFCSVVGGWLMYLLYLRPYYRSQSPRNPRQGAHGLEVIVCGFPRTGTSSLTQALQSLGFNCFHGGRLSQPSTAKLFLRAYKYGSPKEWRKLFEGFTAVTDYPGTCSYKELARVFPNARIILSTRDANKWYDSFSNTVLKHTQGKDYKVFKIVTTYGIECVTKSLYKQYFDGKPEDRDICVKAFLKHENEVKAHVPPEKLLVYDIEKEEGWTSLCKFLNVPIPHEPFPKRNERKSYKEDLINAYGKFYTMILWMYVAIVACIFIWLI